MKIGIGYYATDSIFDSSRGQQALTIATVLKQLGHTVLLINQSLDKDWWKDEKVMVGQFDRVLMKDLVLQPSKQLDLFIDIDGICLGPVRAQIARRTAVLFRGNPEFRFLEKATYMEQSPLYTLTGVAEVWVWDAFVEESHVPMLQSLFEGLPVRRVPYVWIADFVAQQTPTSQKGICQPILIAEKNTTNTSSSVVPLVAAAKWARADVIRLIGAESLVSDKFFQKNIRDMCKINCPLTYEARSRCVDWSGIVLSHTRFMPFRPMLLDLIWLGIPFLHNCPVLKDSPGIYYPESEIDAICRGLDAVELKDGKDWVMDRWSVQKFGGGI